MKALRTMWTMPVGRVIVTSLNAEGEPLLQTDPGTVPVHAVDAINAVFGRHPGM